MHRAVLLLVLVIGLTPTVARAGGFCIKLSLNNIDYTLVLDRVPKKPKPVVGYSAVYTGPGYFYRPVAGTGHYVGGFPRVILSLTEYGNGTSAGGAPSSIASPMFLSIRCDVGSDGKLNAADTCTGQRTSVNLGVFQQLTSGQVVPCIPEAAPPLP